LIKNMSEKITPSACPDCNAKVGKIHSMGCDVECCYVCGSQRLSCSCVTQVRVVWSGQLPGELECSEYGFYEKMVAGQGWVPCEKEDAGAKPDLNRLHAETVWVPSLGRRMMVVGSNLK
jgi:hypothetical protein